MELDVDFVSMDRTPVCQRFSRPIVKRPDWTRALESLGRFLRSGISEPIPCAVAAPQESVYGHGRPVHESSQSYRTIPQFMTSARCCAALMTGLKAACRARRRRLEIGPAVLWPVRAESGGPGAGQHEHSVRPLSAPANSRDQLRRSGGHLHGRAHARLPELPRGAPHGARQALPTGHDRQPAGLVPRSRGSGHDESLERAAVQDVPVGSRATRGLQRTLRCTRMSCWASSSK